MKITVNADNFNRAVTQMSRLAERDFHTVLKSEIGSVLNTCIKTTKQAKVKDIVAAVRYKTPAMTKRINARKKARGLAKQAWVQIADLLGVPVKASQQARRAKPSNGKTYRNAKVKVKPKQITIETEEPQARIRGRKILGSAINRRTAYFYRNLKAKYFEKLEHIKKKYPGWA